MSFKDPFCDDQNVINIYKHKIKITKDSIHLVLEDAWRDFQTVW
jgi:hypothetical protein